MCLKYNQQDATFSWSIYFNKLLYVFRSVPPPIIRRTAFHLTLDRSRQQYWFDNTWRCMHSFVFLMMGGGTSSISSSTPSGSSIGLTILDAVCTVLRSWWWAEEPVPSHPRHHQATVLVWQYLTLYAQFCAPDDGWRNRPKHVEQFIVMNRPRKRAFVGCTLEIGF
jgi:hypothetical protein